MWTKIFCPSSRLSDFVWTKIFPNLLFLNQSLSWWLFIEIVLNADWSALPSKRAGVCKTVSGLHFLSKYLLKVSFELITPLLRSTRLVRVFNIQLEKMVIRKKCKVSEVFTIKILCVLKVLFSKMWFRSLNLSAQNAETAPAVEVVTPLQGLWRSIRYHVSSLPWEVFYCFAPVDKNADIF